MSWICESCGNYVDDKFYVCGECGTFKNGISSNYPQKTKICPKCHKEIDKRYSVCPICGYCESTKETKTTYYTNTGTKICPKCRTEIDEKATVCPNCRSKIKGITGKGCLLIAILAVVIIIAIGFIGIVISESNKQKQESDIREKAFSFYSEDKYKKMCKNVTFDELARDKNALKGQTLTFKGEIIQVIDDNMYRIDITLTEYGYTDTIIFSTGDINEKILEGDIVEFWGESVGFYEYGSIFGERITVPKIVAVYYKIIPDDVTSDEAE